MEKTVSEVIEVTPDVARAERARREKARRHLIPYSEYLLPFYKGTKNHSLVAEKLEKVELYIRTKGAEGIGRLMIFKHPRSGKSLQVSRIFPSWVLGKNPDARVMLTAYGADLANADSRKVRDYVGSDRYRAVFGSRSTLDAPVELSMDSAAVAAWDLAAPHQGGVVSAGIGGGITGKGAHLLIIDDPIKNRKDAENAEYRKNLMSWYRSSAYPRLEDGGAIIVTHTRWNPDDLAGQLLKAMAEDPLLADQWECVFLPAIALQDEEYSQDEADFHKNLKKGLYIPYSDPLGRKAGEAMWPEKYDEMALAKIRYNVGDFEFASLYQQLPRLAVGNFFDEQDFKIIDRALVPEKMKWVRFVDLALGESKRSDWNTTLATALDEKTGYVYYRDMLRVHNLDSFLGQLEAWMLSDAEQGVVWGIESNAFQSQVWKDLMKNRALAAVAIRKMITQTDKVTDAQALQTRAKHGLVYLVAGPWVRGFIEEATTFPTGTYDDQIDTASKGLKLLSAAGDKKQAKSHQG